MSPRGVDIIINYSYLLHGKEIQSFLYCVHRVNTICKSVQATLITPGLFAGIRLVILSMTTEQRLC